MKASVLISHMMSQHRVDLASAHEVICKLQGIDPKAHSWPEWSPQANTLRWFDKIDTEILPEIRLNEAVTPDENAILDVLERNFPNPRADMRFIAREIASGMSAGTAETTGSAGTEGSATAKPGRPTPTATPIAEDGQ